MTTQMQTSISSPAIEEVIQKIKLLKKEMGKVVVGQEKMVDRLLIGLFTNGHILLEGVPGLAKTLTISSLAQTLALQFQRIQFTPDLLPADLIGTMIYDPQKGSFEVKKGPIFANIILADEINRSPAKVQSALLEAMQEKQVTIGQETFPLAPPFLVLATQNPVEQEGTYPLPEAQVDRFLMKVYVDYPSRSEEREIMRRMATTSAKVTLEPAMKAEDIFHIRKMVNQVRLDSVLEEYILDLVLCTRNPETYGLERLTRFIAFGASPRGSISLNLVARCHALLQGRDYVLPEDIKATAADVLNHRVLLTFEAEAERVRSSTIVNEILEQLPLP